jgi:hypothetical protein
VVTAHHERLGWVGNVNHLLDTFTSEFAGIYFHDDLVEPTYVERLVAALRRRPDAASAHCDVVLDDRSGDEKIRRSVDYDGTGTERLLRFLLGRERGSLLRSMVRRTTPAGRLRMSPAAVVYEMALVATGPAVGVQDPMYRRWTKRAGGMTVGMHRRPLTDALQGLRFNAAAAIAVIDGMRPSPAERELLEFGLGLYLTDHLRSLETTYAADTAIDLTEVLDGDPVVDVPAAVSELAPDVRDLCVAALERVRRRADAQARTSRA